MARPACTHNHLRYICDAETKDKCILGVWVMRESTVGKTVPTNVFKSKMVGRRFRHNVICPTKWHLSCGMGRSFCYSDPGSLKTLLCILGVFQVSKQEDGFLTLPRCYLYHQMVFKLCNGVGTSSIISLGVFRSVRTLAPSVKLSWEC